MTRTQEIRDHEKASTWLAAGLCLMRIENPTNENFRAVEPWILSTMGEVPALPPPAIIADIGHLALGKPLELIENPQGLEIKLRKALRRYEDHLLGRLVQERRFISVMDALGRLPDYRRTMALGLLVGNILDRINFDGGVAINQGLVRKLKEGRGEDTKQAGLMALARRDPLIDLLTRGYDELASAAENAPVLLNDADVFALENLEILGNLSQRVAISQVVESAQWLSRMLPKVLRPKRSTVGVVPTELEDESTYPTGGFSSISNSGSFENLVTSELVYMEKQAPSESTIDLFELRYAEGELLYYTRDESFFVRRRRQVVFLLDGKLTEARIKDAGAKWQRLVILLGLILCTARQLSERLGEEELTFRIVFVVPKGGLRLLPLEQERSLCDLLLGEWRERGMVEVETNSLKEEFDRAVEVSRQALVQLVHCGMSEPSKRAKEFEPDPRLWMASLDMAEPYPRLDLPTKTGLPDFETMDSAWGGVTTSLLEQLI